MDHTHHVHLAPPELRPLETAAIYGPDNAKIGFASHLHGSGITAQIVVDVGDFLGIGNKAVALPMTEMDFIRDDDGNVHAVTSWTADELRALPVHRD